MKKSIKIKGWHKFAMLGIALLVGLTFSGTSKAAIKVKIKSTTTNYTAFNVQYNDQKITTTNTKGILINGIQMVSYKDIIKNKIGIKTTYNKTSGKITFKANGRTVVVKLYSKTAYINGKKSTLKTAPVRAKFIKQNKTKLLVPIQFVLQKLHYKYQLSNGTVQIYSPFPIYINSTLTYYNGVKSNLVYNTQNFDLSSSIFGIKKNQVVYAPGRQMISGALGLTYRYDTSTKQIFIYDETLNQELNMTLGSTTAYYNGTVFQLPAAPIRIKRKDTKKTYICIPVNSIVKKLGYSYRYSSANKKIYIQANTYLKWSALSTTYESPYVSGITNVVSNYNATTDTIITKVTFDNTDSINKITTTKDTIESNKITFTIPTTCYLPKKSSYNHFYQIINQMTFTQTSTNTNLVFEGYNDLDYSYSIIDKVLTIQMIPKYKSSYSLKIMKPTNYDASNLTNNDYYNSKKFTIELPGDQTSFLTQNPIESNNSNITDVAVSLTSKGTTLITVKTLKLQAYKIYDQQSYISVDVDDSKKLYSAIVILDAGHGGTDPGAVNGTTYEKNLNFIMMYTKMKKFFEGNAPNIKAYWTRTTDTLIPLKDRAAYASKMGADIFVSLHMNAWSTSNVNGTEVYYSASNNSTSFSGITSKKMGTLFKNNIIKVMNTTDRGVLAKTYTVVHYNTVPAILIELGFISGSSDYAKITNAAYQLKATTAIYNSIVQTFEKYPTGR